MDSGTKENRLFYGNTAGMVTVLRDKLSYIKLANDFFWLGRALFAADALDIGAAAFYEDGEAIDFFLREYRECIFRPLQQLRD